MPGILSKIGTTLEMIKWEHSIFALPFALTATLLAARRTARAGARWSGSWWPWWRRAPAAMAFNRWADAELDAENPRTRSRAIPAGLLSRNLCWDLHVWPWLCFWWPQRS